MRCYCSVGYWRWLCNSHYANLWMNLNFPAFLFISNILFYIKETVPRAYTACSFPLTLYELIFLYYWLFMYWDLWWRCRVSEVFVWCGGNNIETSSAHLHARTLPLSHEHRHTNIYSKFTPTHNFPDTFTHPHTHIVVSRPFPRSLSLLTYAHCNISSIPFFSLHTHNYICGVREWETNHFWLNQLKIIVPAFTCMEISNKH